LFRREAHVINYPEEGPPLTDALVSDAERILQVRLPDSYVALMRECNGGYVIRDAFPVTEPTSWAPDHIGVATIFGIAAAGGDETDDPPGMGKGILVTPYMLREWNLPKGIVLIDGDGHRWIALDYRECGPTGIPSVVWLNPDADEDIQLAPTFEDFVSGLVPSDQFFE
jgi:hypothetical protein